MKNLIFLFVLVFSISNVSAQINEGDVPMTKGNNNSFTILIGGDDAKETEKAWSKFIKKYDGKTKKDKKADELVTDDATIKTMSENTIDIYSRFIEKGEDTQLVVWYDLGGAFVSSKTHPDQYAVVKEMLNDFSLERKISNVEDELKEEEGALKKLNKENDGLKKDKEGLEGDIAKYEKKIEEAKAEIEQNLKDQAAKVTEIETQAGLIEKVNGRLKALIKK